MYAYLEYGVYAKRQRDIECRNRNKCINHHGDSVDFNKFAFPTSGTDGSTCGNGIVNTNHVTYSSPHALHGDNEYGRKS